MFVNRSPLSEVIVMKPKSLFPAYVSKPLLFALAFLLVSAVVTSSQVMADSAELSYSFRSEVDRQRYLSLIDDLRCPKCQNQNLADSDAGIALDLRKEVRRLLDEGMSDIEIMDYMVARYGDYVLYRPPLQTNTFILWVLPGAMLLIGLVVVISVVRSRAKQNTESTENDSERLAELLNNNSPQKKQSEIKLSESKSELKE